MANYEGLEYQTVQELIDTLSEIEDRDQACIAAVFTASDLGNPDQGSMVRGANSHLFNKELGFFYEAVLEAVEG